jgi:hypothetical protein
MTTNIRDQIIRPAKKKGKAASPEIESLSKPGKLSIIQGLTQSRLSSNFISSTLSTTTTGCVNVSQQYALRDDTLHFSNRSTLVTSDNNLLLTGDLLIFKSPVRYYGVIMKCDPEGNIIWSNMYDTTGTNTNESLFYYKAVELKDGSFIATGLSDHRSSSKNDIVMTKVDKAGNTIWHRFYKSRLWLDDQSVASGYAQVSQMTQDPVSGDVIVAENFYNLGRGLVRINEQNGDIIWARHYQTLNGVSDRAYGFEIENNEIKYFGQHYDTYSYLSAYRIKLSDGSVIERKNFERTGWILNWLPPLSQQMVRLNNGNYALTGYSSAYPRGVPTPQGFVIEFDPALKFAGAYAFMSDVTSNTANTSLRVYPDGSGIFTMVNVDPVDTTHTHYVQFKNRQILKQRRKEMIKEGSIYDPSAVRLPDGSDLVVKLISNYPTSTARTAFIKMFPTDTSSACLGVDDNSTTIVAFDMKPSHDLFFNIGDNVIEAIPTRDLKRINKPFLRTAECKITSQCDSIRISVSDTVLCMNNTLVVRTSKSPSCGVNVPIAFDSSAVSQLVHQDDSTLLVTFKSPWSGYFSANIEGCTTLKDSIYVRALSTAGQVTIGADTAICDGSQLILNAGNGYASYLWQDGSKKTNLSINKAGVYHVQVEDACGSTYRDTIVVGTAASLTVNAGRIELYVTMNPYK